MKYLFLLIFSSLSIAPLAGQGTLQFNQVINHQDNSGALTCGGNGYSFSDTVPSGKVWKIESLAFTRSNTSFLWKIEINGVTVWCTCGQNPILLSPPIWINSNGIFRLDASYTMPSPCSGSGSGTFGISIIEFNVIP